MTVKLLNSTNLEDLEKEINLFLLDHKNHITIRQGERPLIDVKVVPGYTYEYQWYDDELDRDYIGQQYDKPYFIAVIQY